MERLTVRDDDGRVALVCREDCKGGPACFLCEQRAVDRLAAYEDKCVSPEDVLSAVEMAKVSCKLAVADAYIATGLMPERVAELAKAEQDGRLVVLPCKVGDTVFRLLTPTLRIIEHEIRSIGEAEKVGVQLGNDNLIVQVFLTRKEAEAALERMKGEGENG